jgi:hypothetical protein
VSRSRRANLSLRARDTILARASPGKGDALQSHELIFRRISKGREALWLLFPCFGAFAIPENSAITFSTNPPNSVQMHGRCIEQTTNEDD